MSFARYVGPPKVHNGEPVFGKAYSVRDGMGGSASGVGMDVMIERNMSIHITEEGMSNWEVSDKAYAVVLKPIEDLKPGEVVIVDDWGEDGKLNVEGVGFYGSDYLELLDRTNVFPGVTVMDKNGFWRRVIAVDNSLWVRVNGEFKSPEEFVFPVSSDGDLMMEPLVTCLFWWDGMQGITQNKKYYVKKTIPMMGEKSQFIIMNDMGEESSYPESMFRMG